MSPSFPGLEIIGAGLPRTGTFGLKSILEQLGHGPCYHMQEVFSRPDHVSAWSDARDTAPDWNALFADFRSVADAPACLFWRELALAFPNARVILTVRDKDAWYDSFLSTIYVAMRDPSLLGEGARPALAMAHKLFVEEFLGGQAEDRRAATEAFERHNGAVAAAFPQDRLLTYDLDDGWAPLCAFLGKPVPAEPFPHLNTRESIRRRLGLDRA